MYTVYYTAIEFRIPTVVRLYRHLYAPPRLVRLILDALNPKRLFGKYYCSGYAMYVYVCEVENHTHTDPDTDTHPDWICTENRPPGYLYSICHLQYKCIMYILCI